MYAKTLYKPEFPDFLKQEIQEYTKRKLPHFFMYAKDKTSKQVESKNKSLVNRLENIIIHPRIDTRRLKLDNIDYKILMNNPNIEFECAFHSNGKLNKEKTHPVIVEFVKLNKEYRYKLNFSDSKKQRRLHGDVVRKTQIKQQILYGKTIEYVKNKLYAFEYDKKDIVDILVKYMYCIKPTKYKSLLWLVFGDEIYDNMLKYLRPKYKSIKCVDCGKWFNIYVKNQKTHMCQECKKRYKNNYMKNYMKNLRNVQRNKVC